VVRDRWSEIGRQASACIPILASLAKMRLSHEPQRSAILRRSIGALGFLFAIHPQAIVAQAPSAAPPYSVVVLDAAHGGDDAGANLSAGQEKALTLAMSVRLRSLLAARGFAVVTTRESDVGVDADRRAEIAGHAGAIACLSLHATQAGSGVHIFVSSLASAGETKFVPWKTAQAAWISRSLELAGVLDSALNRAGIAVTLGRVGMPAIDSMACPAVAVEMAPQRTADAPASRGLDDPAVQASLADALAAALVEWRSVARGAREP